MPPSTNDNQGLKIAVAVFVTLSVILAVTTYFGFDGYSEASAKLEQANADASQAKQAQAAAIRSLGEVKEKIGYPKVADEAVTKQIADDQQATVTRVNEIAKSAEDVATEYQTAAGDSVTAGQVKSFIDSLRDAAARLANEPNRTQTSTIDRLLGILASQSSLLGSVVGDYESTRKDLEAANTIAAAQNQVTIASRDDIQAKAQAEIQQNAITLSGLRSQIDELSTRLAEFSTDNANLKTQIAQLNDEYGQQRQQFLSQIQILKADSASEAQGVEQPDGRIINVDYTRNEVHTSLTRRSGAREQQVFTVFDSTSPGVPTNSPKGSIELIRVTDSGSIGRIVKTTSLAEPILSNDLLWSPAFGGVTYALIGKIDINRDGRDDREDLKRLIQSSGGEVVYDLPPAGLGTPIGELTPLTDWYVIDDRKPIYLGSEQNLNPSADEIEAFEKAKSKALDTARLSGVQPKRIGLLLEALGQTPGTARISTGTGRVEGANNQAIQRLTSPRGQSVPTPPPAQDNSTDF